MRYILVAGGVISGIGKGVIASSFGTILKSCGFNVTCIKIDPYINIDAGTFSPYEHGEVFVLDDGSEVDLDLGNYERFLDVTLHADNNITTGKIYQLVINKERNGDYLGKTVQIVPHLTDAIRDWVSRVAQTPVDKENRIPDVCIIELGGTIGDLESIPFLEAFRRFQIDAREDYFCNVLVTLIPQPESTGEAKTKPANASVGELRNRGIPPDLVVCRSQFPVNEDIRKKISNVCQIPFSQVICIHDVSSIYKVPLILENYAILDFLDDKLRLDVPLPLPMDFMLNWKKLVDRIDLLTNSVNITLVGKYTKLKDSYTSVTKALQHASIACGYKLNLEFIKAEDLEESTLISDPVSYHQAWEKLCKSEGVIIPGGFGDRGVEGKISACKYAREKKIPFLGLCLGFQIAVIEFARNVLGRKDANSTEVNPDTKNPVVIEMPEHNQGIMGGTMRLGKRETVFQPENSIIKSLYGNVEMIEERHRHRYEVNPLYVEKLEKAGLRFVGRNRTDERMQILELKDHPYFVATQFHPEYLSRPLNPSPPFLGLILAATKKLDKLLANQEFIDKNDPLKPAMQVL